MPDISELYTLPQAAEALATPAFNKEQMLNQLKGFVKNDLLHSSYAVGDAKTAPRLYSRASLAIAAVLHELTVMGVADLREDNAEHQTIGSQKIITRYPDGALRSASIAMYAWHFEHTLEEKLKEEKERESWTREDWAKYADSLPKQGPMEQAVWFYLANRNMRDHATWDFQLHAFADTEHNWQRVFRGYVIDSSAEEIILPGPETGLVPRSAIFIALDPLFARIFRDMKKAN